MEQILNILTVSLFWAFYPFIHQKKIEARLKNFL